MNARRTLKYDPRTDLTSLLGDDFGKNESRWNGGAFSTDGIVYCIPSSANQVLSIELLGEFSVETKINMEEHPEELGSIFRINDANTASNRTYFDCAVMKFGMQKLLDKVQEHIFLADEVCAVCGLYSIK